MAKRLRDTAWKRRPVYQRLPFRLKGIMDFLENKAESDCLVEINRDLFSAELGTVITDEDLNQLHEGDWVWHVSGDLYFCRDHFLELYATAKENFNARKAAIKKIQAIGLMNESNQFIRPLPDTQPTVPRQSGDTPIIINSRLDLGVGGVGEGEKTPRGEEPQQTNPQPEVQAANTPPQPDHAPLPKFGPRELAEAWNARMAKAKSLRGRRMPLVNLERFDSSQKRWKEARARLDDDPSPEVWLDAIDRMARSEFCRGGSGGNGHDNWVADFDFLVAKDRLTGILEGKWGCTPAKPPPSQAAEPAPVVPERKEPSDPHMPQILKVLKLVAFKRAFPWDKVRDELDEETCGAVERAGGWTTLKNAPVEEIKARLATVMNTPTAGNPDRSRQIQNIAAGLGEMHSMPEIERDYSA